MRRMWRSVLVWGFILAVALSGCGGGKTQTPPEPAAQPQDQTQPPAPAQEPVQLVFWDMIWGPPAYVEVAQKLVDEFNRTHPGIQVTYQSVPWDNFFQTFVTAVTTGTAPDVSTGGGYQQHQLAAMDAILPLDSIIEEWKAEGRLDDFLPGVVEPVQWEGHQIGIPWQVGAHVIWYRKDILEQNGLQVPRTLADFEAVGAALKQKGIALFSFSAGDFIGHHILANLVLVNGGSFFNPDKTLATLSPKNIEVYQLVSDWAKKGYILEGSTGYNMETASKAFFAGQAAFLPHADRLPLAFTADTPEVKDKMAIMPMPRGTDGQQHKNLQFLGSIMVYTQTKHPEEAKAFAKWWSENQLSLFTEGSLGALPVRKSFLNNEMFRNDPIVQQLVDDILPTGVGFNADYPIFLPEAGNLDGSLIYMTLLQDLLLGKDVSQAANSAHNTLKEQTRLN